MLNHRDFEFRYPIKLLLVLVAGLFYPVHNIQAQSPPPVRFQSPQFYPQVPYQPSLPGQPLVPQSVPLPVVLPVSQTPSKLRLLTSQYPLCVVVSDQFANYFVKTETRESGPVRDFVLGAQVVGVQQTSATTKLIFVPHEPAARMLITLSGITNNQTTNSTPQAIVRSEGSYLFELSKQVEFDGNLLKTWSPTALLKINQRNRAAQTQMTGVPIIGSIANQIAINEADRRKPMAEQIAAQKVTQQVGPRFNKEIDDVLTTLNGQLENVVQKRLLQFQMVPKRLQTTSTSDAMLIGLGLNEAASIGLSPPALPANVNGLQIYLHESHLNDLVAKLPLANLELPDTALERLSRFQFGQAQNSEPAVPKLATIIFDGDQPAKFYLRNGAMELELRMAFRPVVGPLIPTQRVIFKTNVQLTETQLILKTDLDSVQPLDPKTEAVFSTIAEKAVRQQMANQLQERTFPATVDLPLPINSKTGQLQVQGLTLDGGWMTLVFGIQNQPVIVQ